MKKLLQLSLCGQVMDEEFSKDGRGHVTKDQEGVVTGMKDTWPDLVLRHNLMLDLEPQCSLNVCHSTNISKPGEFPGGSGVQEHAKGKLLFS